VPYTTYTSFPSLVGVGIAYSKVKPKCPPITGGFSKYSHLLISFLRASFSFSDLAACHFVTIAAASGSSSGT